MALRRPPGSQGRTQAVPGRHFDDGRHLAAYADRIAVRCHRCGTAGWVLAQWQPYRWTARFRCAGCSLSLDSAEGTWVGQVRYSGRSPCGYCGHQWVSVCEQRACAAHAGLTHLPGTCRQCGRQSDVAVGMSRVRDGSPADPHFGLPLHLVESTRAGVVWAYNAAHVQALQAFAVSKLRERGGVHNASMISRLPTWMKLARHRALLQRALERLLQRLPE
ncbi:hypothetical protein ATCM_00830 [Stenotrophomonas sp. ATCM1_4]|uniref:hypothetical protein n=1 Tax=Stenotrophomonas sp. ATCM1_4 TaxID=2259330 RepID=UPI0010437DC9|nr:hypothetical protein [Stenotrophomonas sp. ATCM1_4]TDB26339.1 hypothetical protein ATCM_00830 [Stenotrophomonas sp. ATCM1_4]